MDKVDKDVFVERTEKEENYSCAKCNKRELKASDGFLTFNNKFLCKKCFRDFSAKELSEFLGITYSPFEFPVIKVEEMEE